MIYSLSDGIFVPIRIYSNLIKSVPSPRKVLTLKPITMAIVQNPITGRTRNMFGTAVFSKQFGQNTMRTKPAGMKNPNTPAQSSQRNKFLTVVNLVRQVLPLINAAYAGRLKDMSPFNRIVSLILKTAFSGDPPELDHTKVVFCDIEGSSVSSVSLEGQAAQSMEIMWEPNSNNPDELAALLTFILINVTTNKVMNFPDKESRGSGSTIVTLPADWVGTLTALHVVTFDYSKIVSGNPQTIIQFKAGCDAASTVLA